MICDAVMIFMAFETGDENRLKHLCTSTFSKKMSKGPKSAVFVPESAVFPTYNLEVSRFFRNFALRTLGV